MKLLNSVKAILVVAAVHLVSGCSNKLPQATIHESKTTNVENYDYLVGPGDKLDIFVWRNEEISGSWVVRPDGKITTSLVEDVKVSGKTPTEVARLVEENLKKYVKKPVVTVTVSNFNGPFSEQVRVLGAASQPKALSYTKNMTLMDVMIQVNGLSEYADGNDAVLLRYVDGAEVEYDLNIEDLIMYGDTGENVDILPGDVIVIPETWF